MPGAKGARLTVERSARDAIHRDHYLRRCRATQAGRHNQIDLRPIAEKHLARSAIESDRYVLAENCDPIRVAMDPGASGPAANVAAFTALWMDGG